MESLALWVVLAAGGFIAVADHVVARAYRTASYRVRRAFRWHGEG